MTNKRRAIDELQNLSEAIDESILGAADADIRDELALLGLDPEKVAAEMDAIAQDAKMAAAKLRLARAKEAVNAFRSARTDVSLTDRTLLRSKLRRMRSGRLNDNEGLMIAARKGKQLSPSDEKGVLDDLAQLEELESDDPEASKE